MDQFLDETVIGRIGGVLSFEFPVHYVEEYSHFDVFWLGNLECACDEECEYEYDGVEVLIPLSA